MFFGVISYGPLTDYKWSQWRPQIRKKVDRISNFGPSNPQKRYIDLTNFGPQIRKIADTNHQELPGAYFHMNIPDHIGFLATRDACHKENNHQLPTSTQTRRTWQDALKGH
jgi:hypothetical protein